VKTLGRVGKEASPAVPLLKRLLSPYPVEAGLALWRIEGKTDDVLPALRKALEEGAGPPTRFLRRQDTLYGTVVALGPAGKPLLPLLKKRLSCSGQEGIHAAVALLSLEAADRDALTRLEKGLTDAEAPARAEAAHALGRLGERGKDLLPALKA